MDFTAPLHAAPGDSSVSRAGLLLRLIRHIGVVLLEALGQALARGQVLLDAARDAAVLALGDGLGGEVVDAGGEAAVDEVAEKLWG